MLAGCESARAAFALAIHSLARAAVLLAFEERATDFKGHHACLLWVRVAEFGTEVVPPEDNHKPVPANRENQELPSIYFDLAQLLT